MHIVRDPCDMLFSACSYHQRVPKSRELWLHIARERLNGMSCQEYISKLPSHEDKLLFEMKGSHRVNINHMKEWNYNNPRSIEVKFEKMMEDHKGVIFNKTLRAVGFTEQEADYGTSIFVSNHVKASGGLDVPAAHVREGETSYLKEFSRNVAVKYSKLHDDILFKLGYENDAR